MKRLFPILCATVALALAIAAPLALGAAAPVSLVSNGAAASANAGSVQPATATQIDAYLATKGSPMTGQGAAFVASGGRWQVDPRLLVAIAGAESSFGQITCAPFNAWGYGCPNGPYRFESWADGIDTVMQGLRTSYLAEGRTTVALINLKYAPVGAANDPTGLNNNWTVNVSRFMVELGGDPNDLDMDGIAGSLPLGPLGGPALESFGFAEEQATDSGRASDSANSGSSETLEVAAGDPRPLVVQVRNTGSVAWHPEDVRLRRVDSETRVAGAPYGALASPKPIEPNGVAKFVVQLAAAGSSDGTATTVWRLEGPSGPFGEEIHRDVRFAVPAFVAGSPVVTVASDTAGSVGGGPVWSVVVRVRNVGSRSWHRDGDEAVLLGLTSTDGTWTPEGWINDHVAARMLEREAAPGENASFAFRVRGTAAALRLRPFRRSGWASGDEVLVTLGSASHVPAAPL